MVIYGLFLMGLCMLIGNFVGNLFGAMLGISANIGGVGIAMVLLVVISQRLMDKKKLSEAAQAGIGFWSAMYIPIVVAMAAQQNVVSAMNGGALAFVAGLGAVFVGFLLIKPISALGGKSDVAEDSVKGH
ncbi:transporter [Rhodospirillum rubrum F11]|uniref:Transporter n=1 Tax=Rhodospirillum rubrum (strain ATCC 11170 / ATH 1.1.1 / DSM 467 / LMG 4362 / NCIMB 8255 / S1) TaxID=269796 RepID=Q2RUR5_RHORT|nr:malonate transporter subunit MadL [Rhodospirillum rubrum]ABC22130.1 transporter [Rhodospirillum rubrum ATCC 11170]AEO47845.1 transporter [Rhodospirillum rubrum F11]MBK5953719.1 transporter [Rhodospirillum rubrum]QXG81779.1 malonate transporter subunit MadL [Rhodospirillum rubrum]